MSFLLDPDEWDDRFALLKASEMKVPGGLTAEHWQILLEKTKSRYVRRQAPFKDLQLIERLAAESSR